MLLAFEMRLLLCLDLYTIVSGRFHIIRLVFFSPIYSMQVKKGYYIHSYVCGFVWVCVGKKKQLHDEWLPCAGLYFKYLSLNEKKNM